MSYVQQVRCLERGALQTRVIFLLPRTSIRFASQVTNIASSKSKTSSTYSVPNPRINPPATCRPPPLVLPGKRKPGENPALHLYQTGKAYLVFYKAAVKGVWSNGRVSRQAMKAAKGNKVSESDKIVPSRSRAEFQLMWRQLHDGRRLPLFAIMLAVFFEFLPVIMIAFRRQLTPILPYPCRLPEQVKISKMNRLKMQQRAEARLGGRTTKDLDEKEYIRYSAEFHGIKFPILPFALQPFWYLFRGVRKYYDYLRWDDLLIHRDGGVSALMDEEVEIAALDRGLWEPDTSTSELRKRLHKNVDDTFKQEQVYLKKRAQEEEQEKVRQLQREQYEAYAAKEKLARQQKK